jgi:hypothetical protein
MPEQFGFDFDYVDNATGVLLSLRLAAGVTLFLIGADTYTLKSANAYNGSPSTLATITNYYTNPQTNGSGAWTQQIQAAADSITIASGMAVLYVDGADLPAGANYVEITVGGSGVVRAVYGDLTAPRTPPNLPTRSGSAS